MEPKYVTSEQAKFFSSKELDIDCTSFYVKPNCKLFSVDEHGRHYPIKNTPKKLYKLGEHFVLKDENVILAPEQHQVVDWLLEKHGIFIEVFADDTKENPKDWFYNYNLTIKRKKGDLRKWLGETATGFLSPKEAYSAAFDYIKDNNLI